MAWCTDAAMMPRFRGMILGFCTDIASSGVGLGYQVLSIRFTPVPGREAELGEWLAKQVIPGLSLRYGVASTQFLQPALKPPTTREQSIRGPDADMSWIVLVSAYEAKALEQISNEDLSTSALRQHGCSAEIEAGIYQLQYTLTAQETLRSAPNPPISPIS